jgi:hypothetical protein
VSLACPSCGRTIAIKDAKPGRFRVPCPECGRPFRLEVGDGAEPSLVARPIEEPAESRAPTDPLADARQVGLRVLAAMSERAGWAWRALIHRKTTVGGALTLQELGRTSLGIVARGRQVLLGRDVLVRTMPADWGTGPAGLARAYELAVVSAEVVHPNLLRRLGFGEDRGRRYAIEEAVEGSTLATLSARDDWHGGDAALVPILDVARGLLAAHEQGLAHGQLSAEHIWIDDRGAVRLAGIGLTTTGTETRDGAEPFALSAARDVQSLGRTLDTLATPRKAGGATVSPKVRAIVGRMRAAGTPDGFRDLAEAVAAMESVLGSGSIPEGESARLAAIVDRYHDSPLASLRTKLAAGFIGVCMLFAILFTLAGRFTAAAGVLGLPGMTAGVYGLLRAGIGQRPGVFGKARELVLGGRRADWFTVLAVVVGAIVVLFALGWLAAWIALGLVSAIFAVGFLVALDAPIDRDREGPLGEARDLLASLRAQGMSELSVREFACKAGGDRWDELYEALFGLEETRRARAAWDDAHSPRFRVGGWRFPVLDWLDARLRDRREARARAMFEPVEEAALVAQKVNEMTARRKSGRIAEALIIVAREVRAASLARLAPDRSDTIRVTPRPVPDLIREAVETPDKLLTTTWSDERDKERDPNPLLRLVAALTGPRARFLLGGLLCALFLLWAEQVGIVSSTEIREKAERAIAERDVGRLQEVNVDVARIHTADEALRIPGVPESLTRFVSGYGVGAAGLILIVSALVAGSRIALVAIPAATIAWLGPKVGIPAIGPLVAPAVAAAIGAGLLFSGMIWESRR